MPGPGPAYNLLCVLTSAADILSHAARIRAAQATATSYGASITADPRKRRRTDVETQESLENGQTIYSTLVEAGPDREIPSRGIEPQPSKYTGFSSGVPVGAVPTPPFPKNLEAPEVKADISGPEKLPPIPEAGPVDASPSSDSSSSKPVDQNVILPQEVSTHDAS